MRASTTGIRSWLFTILLLAASLFGSSQSALAQLAAPSQPNHISAELLLVEDDGAGTQTYALHFTPQPGWHGYWRNPGDAGFGMQLAWSWPAAWFGEPEYPVPQQLVISGLMNHVYERDYTVLVPVKRPADAALPDAEPGDRAPLSVKANWLACTDEVCVPEGATLNARPGNAGASGAGRDPRIDAWRAAIPPLLDARERFALTPATLRIAIPLPASLALDKPHVFLVDEQVVAYAAPQIFRRDGDLLVVEIPRGGPRLEPGAVSGILSLDDSGNGVTFAASPGTVPAGGELVGGGGAAASTSLWLLLGAALAGGLVLNLMPCVFPILSLKALHLARAGGQGAEIEGGARREGLAYTAGVMLACVALGALLLVLRAGGSEIGWAFQLQEPGVVVALLVLAVAITANFASLFELPSLSFTGSGGRASAFSTGLLAAFVATPCTGPFMAAALGAALVLPWWEGLLLFATLGFGLALPFLLLGFIPPLRKLLPKPGKWMDWFRKFMAIPMGLTALALAWLCWRLGGQWFALGALVVALAATAALAYLWRPVVAIRPGRKLGAAIAGAVAILSAVSLSAQYSPPAAGAADGLLAATQFSDTALADARASGKPVFLWFTADWCLTCKVNENLAIEREATRDAFAKAGVVAMSGDWTRRDPDITRFLTAHGVAGVPLYLWYPAGGGEPEVLPQVLTPDSLVERAAAS